MALKTLLLRNKLDSRMKALEDLRSKEEGLNVREAELEAAIGEMTVDTTDEDRESVERSVDELKSERDSLVEEIDALETEIRKIEEEITAEEEKTAEPEAEPADVRSAKEEKEERKEVSKMSVRTKFYGMTVEQRDAFFQREDVKTFVGEMRAIAQNRAVTNGSYTIPTVILELIKADIEKYSKLYKHVLVKPVAGAARQPIIASVPTAVWSEMDGSVNEVTIAFGKVEVDGYKVGAYVPVANSLLEDSDVNLGSEIITILGQSIGLALDKAIVYGEGSTKKQPVGFAANATSKSIASTVKNLDLFRALIEYTGECKNAFGELVWVMNNKTHAKIQAAALGVNAAAVISSGINDQMPIVGGAIEVLDFVPDDNIACGYGKRYLLAERAGIKVGKSEEAAFVADNTIFKATARYDGKPVFNDSFLIVGINGATPAVKL